MLPDRLIVFAKRPMPGRVKTRLVPPLTVDEAAALYDAILRDVVALAARQHAQLELWYQRGVGAREFFREHFPVVPLQPQGGGELGEKLADAFQRSFASGAERVVIIGSDSPTLPESVLTGAFEALDDADLVLGPASDGGYYLVGLRAAAWPRGTVLFDHIPWSTPDVLRRTRERAEKKGLSLRALPGWYDVDGVEDLRQAQRDTEPDSHLAHWLEQRPDLTGSPRA
ncbi:MAG: TIGR04282 family arsenosugar biosynthesis glycosyltransferase [Longimicrobiales bacterium]